MPQTSSFDNGIPSEIDMRSADQLRQILASGMTVESGDIAFDVVLPGETTAQKIVLTHGVAKTLLDMLRLIGLQRGFHIIPYSAELSTQEAADLLNVSRPYLVKLLDAGDIPHHKVGRHRRISAAHLFRYREKRDADRDAALSTLAENDSAYGLV